jgi:hypothetical protein
MHIGNVLTTFDIAAVSDDTVDNWSHGDACAWDDTQVALDSGVVHRRPEACKTLCEMTMIPDAGGDV